MDYSFKKDGNKKNPSNRSSSSDSKTSPSRSSFHDMESSSNYTVPDENLSKLLRQKGKRATANLIQSECSANGSSENLDAMLDDLLSPDKDIYDSDNIEWCKWIIAGGKSPSEFSSIVRGYDNHAKCGLVWIPHVVAYRCRTCGTSPCMSICRDCFKRGNHKNHDFNMFLSQAGGACDCGDTSVMKAEGFCSDHGINNCANKGPVPPDLMCVAEAMMPRLLLRLLLHFRGHHTDRAHSYNYERAAKDCDEYCSMLMEFNNMGELMRRVMTNTLIDPEIYKKLVEPPFPNNRFGDYLAKSKQKYEEAVKLFPGPEPPDEYKHLPALGRIVVHKTLLEEFIFWTFKFEFPQSIVCFLLNMLPDQDYKEHLTRTFVMHYSRIPTVLETSYDPDRLSNRIVHVSVQLFSNEQLALKMVEELNLLHVMIISLKLMMSNILTPNTLHDPDKNFHFVIDCARRVMKEHCYWPLVSDFNNVLSHESVALVFLKDDNLIDMWFQFLSMLQGMNVNIRETASHVEFEPSSYYAAFSCELEASACPMWSIISHLKDSTYAYLAKKIMIVCVNYLQDWLDAVNFYQPKIEKNELIHASFHFPLHRYLAAFIYQGVKTMGMSLSDILPSPETITLLMMHPLRVQALFYEVLSGIWVRNGLQIKGQAMTYIQANFCNSLVDMDLFFLQICATQLPANLFLTTSIDIFGVTDWFNIGRLVQPQEMEQDAMLEGLLTFLATLVTSRTNLGNDEPTKCIIEISALLATSDKTHSQLLELMPERSGNAHTRNFEKYLKELSTYRPPPLGSENLEQGLFMPLPCVWEKFYDPLHVLLRAVHRRDFRTSMDRFSAYVKQEKKLPKSGNLWPPFRLPNQVGKEYSDPACILNSKVLHSMLLGIFYKAVHVHNVSENLLALAVFLLEIAVTINENKKESTSVMESAASNANNSGYQSCDAPELLNCYPSNCLSENLRLSVGKISLVPQEPQVSPANYNTQFDSDIEWELSESDTLPMLIGGVDNDCGNNVMDVAVPQDLSVVRGNSLMANHSMDSMDDDMSPSGAALPPLMPSDSTAVVEYNRNVGVATVNPTGGAHLALPSTTVNESDLQVAILRESNAVANMSNAFVLPFARVQPVAVPNRNMDIVQANPRRTTASGRRRTIDGASSMSQNAESDVVNIDESIISLLLQLHSQLSNTLDSFSLEDDIDDEDGDDYEEDDDEGPSTSQHAKIKISESRIGDGPYFIGNVLKKIAKMDENCARNINEIRQKLWPNQRERQAEQRAREAKEKEERAKRARERQQKLMQDFAARQKQFMEQAMNSDSMMEGIDDEEEEMEAREKEYDCIICNTSGPSTESNPIGLVVLVESSSIVGHRRKTTDRFPLPVCDDDKQIPGRNIRLSSEFNKRTEILHWKFGLSQLFLSHNIGWEGGVHVQSCGHHVHLTCQDSYLKSLYSPLRPQNLNVDHGEFFCPVCRQLANSVLPLSPQLDRITPMIRVPAPPFETLVTELMNLIKENKRPTTTTKFYEAMGRAMESMTNSTRHMKKPPPTIPSLFSFVISIARTNLESEVIQRGGSLCSLNDVRYRPKRDCIVPLLHVLSLHVRLLINDPCLVSLMMNEDGPVWRSWANLCGIPSEDNKAPVPSCSSGNYAGKVPNLVADPCALMLKFILLAPLQMDQAFFTAIVKVMYSLLYYQVVLQLCIKLTDLEVDEIIEKYSSSRPLAHTGVGNLGAAMALMLENLDRCKKFRKDLLDYDDDMADMSNEFGESSKSATAKEQKTASDDPEKSGVNIKALEAELQMLCLPFLRIAALLRHHIYHQELPEVKTPELEFARLVYFLELVTKSMDWDKFNATKALCFVPNTEFSLPKHWCEELMELGPPHDTTRDLLMNQHVAWQQPKLLGLPREYERLFTYYHEQSCLKCSSVPKESSICLLCGTIVCLKQACCKEQDCCEAVKHSISCGGGTGVFLVVASTCIIIIRGSRACLWGSLYLDDFDEEDRDLKRGKPLYLSEDRFNLLESQWMSHRFGHTKHTWVWHRDSL